MTSNEIYEAAKQYALIKIRHQRNPHAPQEFENRSDLQLAFKQELFGIKDVNAKSYSWVIQQAELFSIEMFKRIIVDLLKKYKIEHMIVNYDKRKVYPEPIVAFVTEKDKTLFVVRNLYDEQFQQEFISAVTEVYKARSLKTILMVHDYAYKFMFNHNNDEKDPSRGTGLYSIRYMFETLFGTEEYECFKTFEQNYTEEVRRYLGYQVVKTLTPNALYSFKKVVEQKLISFPYRKHISELATTAIPTQQLDAIMKQFLQKKYYKALVGKKEYAQSFVTAEWLYDTMKEAGRIDYTAVVMGYFKAVEQLMFEFIKRHMDPGRKLKKKGSKGYDSLTKINLDADKLDTTLGALIGFLKYYHNRDLFIPEIKTNSVAQDGILSIIDQAKEDRNIYFHKKNINKPEKKDEDDIIEKARILSYSILALLLGAYEYSDQDRVTLNIPEENGETDYEKLCGYINYNSAHLFYISSDGSELMPVYAVADDNVKIDEYGDSKFSGVYFQKILGIGSEKIEISINDIMTKHVLSAGAIEMYQEDSLPFKIYTGSAIPSRKGMLFSGPLKLIYENGRYMLPEQLFYSGY